MSVISSSSSLFGIDFSKLSLVGTPDHHRHRHDVSLEHDPNCHHHDQALRRKRHHYYTSHRSDDQHVATNHNDDDGNITTHLSSNTTLSMIQHHHPSHQQFGTFPMSGTVLMAETTTTTTTPPPHHPRRQGKQRLLRYIQLRRQRRRRQQQQQQQQQRSSFFRTMTDRIHQEDSHTYSLHGITLSTRHHVMTTTTESPWGHPNSLTEVSATTTTTTTTTDEPSTTLPTTTSSILYERPRGSRRRQWKQWIQHYVRLRRIRQRSRHRSTSNFSNVVSIMPHLLAETNASSSSSSSSLVENNGLFQFNAANTFGSIASSDANHRRRICRQRRMIVRQNRQSGGSIHADTIDSVVIGSDHDANIIQSTLPINGNQQQQQQLPPPGRRYVKAKRPLPVAAASAFVAVRCSDDNHEDNKRQSKKQPITKTMTIWETVTYQAPDPSTIRKKLRFLYHPISSSSTCSRPKQQQVGTMMSSNDHGKDENEMDAKRIIIEEVEECPICQMPMISDVVNTICGHQFHGTCLLEAFTKIRGAKCPLCRQMLLERWSTSTKSPSGTMTIGISSSSSSSSTTTTLKDTMTMMTSSTNHIEHEMIQIQFVIPLSTTDNSLKEEIFHLSLYVPYHSDGYDLMKRLKYTFLHGLLFEFSLPNPPNNTNKQMITSFLLTHLQSDSNNDHDNTTKNVMISLSSSRNTSNIDESTYYLSNEDVEKCHRLCDNRNIPQANSWWIHEIS